MLAGQIQTAHLPKDPSYALTMRGPDKVGVELIVFYFSGLINLKSGMKNFFWSSYNFLSHNEYCCFHSDAQKPTHLVVPQEQNFILSENVLLTLL